jgi:hypothetical protein
VGWEKGGGRERVHQDAETCAITVVGLKFNAFELFDIMSQLTIKGDC